MPSLARSRWVLASVLAGLSVLAITVTWGRQISGKYICSWREEGTHTVNSFEMNVTNAADDEDSYVPRIGSDIREPALVFGSAGLGGLMVM